MSFFPVHSIGILNLWVLMALFSLPILFTISIKRHVFRATSSQFKSSRTRGEFRVFLAAKFYMMFYFIYSIFIPLNFDSTSATVGLLIYIAGFSVYSSAWTIIAISGEGKLFIHGPFRYSRHPVYLSAAVMFLGAGLFSNSVLFLLLSILTGISHMHNAKDEERICLETFGDEYRAYMDRTPRWIGLRRSL